MRNAPTNMVFAALLIPLKIRQEIRRRVRNRYQGKVIDRAHCAFPVMHGDADRKVGRMTEAPR